MTLIPVKGLRLDERRWRIIGFLSVFLIVLLIYLYSVAPTVSFWDCGEFLACSYILGVPHPPGTPLFVLLGRVFSLIPFSKEIALRINLISVFAGALSSAFGYLLIVKLLSMWKGVKEHRFIPHIAGVAGAFLMASAFSFWDNSVEAEVYTTSTLIVFVLIWVGMLWRERVEKGIGDSRLVLFILYMVFLSAGIHLTPVLVLPALLAFIWVVDREALLQLRIIEFMALFFIMLLISGLPVLSNFVLFMATPPIAVATLAVDRFVGFIALLIIFGIYLYYLHSKGRLDGKYIAWGFFLMGIAGTVHFYLMVRAHLNPHINEVNPTTWRDFLSVLRREQYEPMKLLPRKTQFLSEQDAYMGIPTFSVIVAYFEQIKFYLRYFFWQWNWQSIIGFIPPVLGIYGIYRQYKEERKSFILMGTALLVASLGLVTYLNLKYSPSDPRSNLQYREVRERDYFFALSFVLYALFAGLGIGALIQDLSKKIRLKRRTVIAVSVIVLTFSSSFFFINYKRVTRRGNWIPAEYGYNLLSSCKKGVLFTNGDNDTFPLWFMQEVPSKVSNYQERFKYDVIVANLSLINTHWYIKELKDWGAPISFTYEEIENLLKNFRPFMTKDKRVMVLKDVMIRDIIATSAGIRLKHPESPDRIAWENSDYAMSTEEFQKRVLDNYPRNPKMEVYFANTVAKENLKDMGQYISQGRFIRYKYLSTEGLVYRVKRAEGPPYDFLRTRHLLYNVYKLNSILDKRVAKDENTKGLLQNYAATYLEYAGECQFRGLISEAEKTYNKIKDFELEPRFLKLVMSQTYKGLSEISLTQGRVKEALGYLDSVDKLGVRDPSATILRGYIYEAMGRYNLAEREYETAYRMVPKDPRPLNFLLRLYLNKMYDTAKAKDVLRGWLNIHPEDTGAASFLHKLEGR